MVETSARPQVLDVRNLRIEAVTETGNRVTLVDDISFVVNKGEVLGLIGESGAGKSAIGLSTLIYVRNGCQITGGQILFQGHELRDLDIDGRQSLRGANVAYIGQSAADAFNPAHTLYDQVCEVALQRGAMTFAQARNEAIRLFRELDLPSPELFGNRYPHQVSGGDLQRAMVAMAMIAKPDLLVFDEPTAVLDVTAQLEALALFKKLIREHDTAAIYIGRDPAVVAQIADRIMVVERGKVVEEGATAQLLQLPRMDYTRALMRKDSAPKPHRLAEIHPEGAAPVLQVQNLVAGRRGGPRILDDVSVDLMRGETLAVVGESGSGKSALARVVAGLVPRKEGEILLGGAGLPARLESRSRDQHRRIQLVHQRPEMALNPRHTLLDIIGRPVAFYFNKGRADVRARVEELLLLVDLPPESLTMRPENLSGAEKQRACIARALAAEPDAIVCDDVTASLDPTATEDIADLLRRAQVQAGFGCIFITGDPALARRIADKAAVLQSGQLVAYGPVGQVFNPPYHPYTELLLTSAPEMRPDWLYDALRRRRKVMR